MSELVSNQPPKVDPGAIRLAVVGESPGLGEVSWRVCSSGHGFEGWSWKRGQKVETVTCPSCGSAKWQSSPQPFRGPSGRMLDWLLREAGLPRDRCFIGNAAPRLCSPDELNRPDGIALRVGHALLCDELRAFRPNCVLLLGNTALRMFHPWRWSKFGAIDGGLVAPDLLGEEAPELVAIEPACKITDWRGSIFAAGPLSPLPGVKCVAAYHPAAVLRQPDWQPLLEFDVRRAVAEAATAELNLPERKIDWPRDGSRASAAELRLALKNLHNVLGKLGGMTLAFDLEGYATTGMTLCSFAWSATEALSVPLRHADGSAWWSPSDEQAVMDALRAVLEDPQVPKVCHHGSYEMFVLAWAHRIKLRGLVGDTMLATHEAFPELEKALEVIASLVTRQPYWKHGRDASDDAAAVLYNCTDSCVTWEIDAGLRGTNPATGQPYLNDGQRAHYQFNLSLLEPLNEMMLRGLRFDAVARDALVTSLRAEQNALAGELDALAGILAPSLEEVAAALCWKKKLEQVWTWDDVVECAKPASKEKAERVVNLLDPPDQPRAIPPDCSLVSLGEANALLERGVNVASTKLTKWLYDPPPKGWGFEPQFIKEGNRNTSRLARDTGALLSLLRKHPGDRRLELCLALINRATQLKQLQMTTDADGRVRFAVNIAGTVTQRHTCHESNTGSGGNFHSTPDNHKHLFLADDGCDMWNVDLAGADGWTIGAEMAALGDMRMLHDLQAGIKPAAAVALLYLHGAKVNSWNYETLRAALPGIKDPPWLYYTCKKAVWGCCYGLGELTLSQQIMEDSYKDTGTAIYVDTRTCRSLLALVHARYLGIRRRQQRIAMLLERDGYLDAPNGSRRIFFGRHDDPATLREAYSHTPQVMTTYVTSLAWWAMWSDPDNIRHDGSRIAMPALLIHDAILFQAPQDRRDWVAAKLPQWFSAKVCIAGTTVTIPYGATRGPSWGQQEPL